MTGILDAHLASISNRLADVSRLIAVIATLFGPLTVITGLFGMNVPLPSLWLPGTGPFWEVVAFMAISCGLMYWWFKKSGWLSMGRITKLPEELANQIAAGEVVERPASVIKELVENAIDAEARRITITTEYGGKKLIRVEDDGIGMDPDDARLSLDRHATSKIRRADDLGAIVTLGFRGEALPSMASVSHFRMRTRAARGSGGTEIRVNAGVVESVVEAGGPEGTLVEVADLFYNLPARRKFLKSDAAESAQISKTVTQLALCYPGSASRYATPAARCCVPAGGVNRGPAVPVLRRALGPRAGGARALSGSAFTASSPRWPSTGRHAGRSTCSSTGESSRTRRSRTQFSTPTASRRTRSAAPRCTCSSRSRRSAWTSTSIRPRRKCASRSSRSSTRSFAARVADALGPGPAPELTLRPADVIQAARCRSHPGRARAGRIRIAGPAPRGGSARDTAPATRGAFRMRTLEGTRRAARLAGCGR